MIKKNKVISPFFEILKNNKKIFIFDTETNGLGSLNEPPKMVEFSGLKYEVQRKLNIKNLETEKKIELTFNNRKKILDYEKIIKVNEETGEIEEILLTDGNFLQIKYNIPIIKQIPKNQKSKIKYELLFNSWGEFKLEKEIDELYKIDYEIEPFALLVHKIYDKEYIKNNYKDMEEFSNFANTLTMNFKEKYLNKDIKKIENSIIKKNEDITKLKNKIEKTDLEKKEIKIFTSELTKMKLELKEAKSNLKKCNDFERQLKKEKKDVDKAKSILFEFFYAFDFRNNENSPYITDESRKQLLEEINNTDNVNVGHNVFNFDIKNVLEPEIGKINNKNVLDTLFFPLDFTNGKKRSTLDKFISDAIKVKTEEIKKDFNESIHFLSSSKIKNEFPNIPIENILKNFNDFFILKILRNKPLEKEELEKIKDDFEVLKKNNVDIANLIEFEDIKYINYINGLFEQRKGIHTASLDIKLNLFAFENLGKNFFKLHGFNDVFVDIKNISNIEKIDDNIKKEDIDFIDSYLGLKTTFSNGVITKNNDIKEKLNELNIKNCMISDDSFTNAYNDIDTFKDSGIKNAISVKVKLFGEGFSENGENINIVFPTQKDYFNSILLINDYKITIDKLKTLLDRTNIKIFIDKKLDDKIKNKNIFIKVSPYNGKDYSQKTINKRVLWIENKYTNNSTKEKTLQYIWTKISANETMNLVKINNINNEENDYQNYHIPSKEELLTYFPMNEFKDIYQNANEIIEECEVYSLDPKHLPMIPTFKRLQNNIKENPKSSEEFKEIMSNVLKKQWKDREMEKLIKIKSIKRFYKMKKKEFDELSSYSLKTLSKTDKNFIREKIIDTDLSKMNKQELIDYSNREFFIENKKFITNEELAKRGKNSDEIRLINELREFYFNIKKEYGDRVTYELNALTDFENYEVVFNYYFLMRKILKVLEAKGISHGPGRGSAAGSIISFLMDITDIDPVDDDLLFERFMNPERVSMPDIDTDLPMSKEITKDLIIEILENSFKMSNEEAIEFFNNFKLYDKKIVEKSLDDLRYTSKISTVMYSSEKTVFGDLFRLLGMNGLRLSEVRRSYNDDINISDNMYNIPEVDSYLNSIGFLIDDLKKLNKLVSNKGKHAGGVNISGGPANSHGMIDENTNVFTKDIAANEAKMDLLGLVGQVLIDALDEKEEVSKVTNKIETLDYNFSINEDNLIWQNIQNGLTANVFQIESDGMVQMLKKLAPLDFDTLIAALALYRPGPMEAGSVDEYINNKYIDIQKKYARYIEKVLKRKVKPGNLNKEETDLIYSKIINKKFTDLVSNDLFFNIMNAIPHTKTAQFKNTISNNLDEIINIVKNEPNITPEEALEIKNSIIEDPEKQNTDLKTIEKEFLKYYADNRSIEKSREKAISFAEKIENEINNAEVYSDITKETYNTVIYQEQIMQMATRIAGFTKGESDALRKVIAKSKQLQIIKFKDALIKGFTNRIDKIIFENGNEIYKNNNFETIININGNEINLFNSPFSIDEDNNLEINFTPVDLKQKRILENFNVEDLEKVIEIISTPIKEVKKTKTYSQKAAEYLFDNIVGFGSYAFNKSHSASYARITYKTAFYKTYYPEKFYAIALENASKRSTQALLREIGTKTDIKIKIADINNIKRGFKYNLEKGEIIFSPSKLKSIKSDAIDAIVNEQEKGVKFKSLFDLKIQSGSIVDKGTIKQLGISKILEPISGDITSKIFKEYDTEINNALKKFEDNEMKRVASKSNDKNKFLQYLKIKNTIKKNNVYEGQIKKNNQLLNSVKDRYLKNSNNEFIIEENKELETLNNDNYLEDEVDSEEILVQLEKLQNKIKDISVEDKENIKFIEKTYPELIKEYYSNKSNDNLVEAIRNEIEDSEKLKRYNYLVENKINFSEIEKEEVNIELFAEYNFSPIKVNISNRNLGKDKLTSQIKEFYNGISEFLLSHPDYQDNEKLKNINKQYFYVGKHPKIIVMAENNIYSKVSGIVYQGEDLKVEHKNFTDKEGKIVKYDRYFNSKGEEFKFNGRSKKLEKVIRNGGTSYKTISDKEYTLKQNDNSIYNHFKDIVSQTPNINMDDIAIMSYFPFSKNSVPKKMVGESIYFNKLKEFLQEVKPGLLVPTGVELVKAVKGLHKFKREEFDTNYHMPYHFNFDDKKKNIEDQVFSKVIFFENPSGLEFALTKTEDEISRKEILEKLRKSKVELFNSFSNIKNNDFDVENSINNNSNVEIENV